jgi:hypothetical protein
MKRVLLGRSAAGLARRAKLTPATPLRAMVASAAMVAAFSSPGMSAGYVGYVVATHAGSGCFMGKSALLRRKLVRVQCRAVKNSPHPAAGRGGQVSACKL